MKETDGITLVQADPYIINPALPEHWVLKWKNKKLTSWLKLDLKVARWHMVILECCPRRESTIIYNNCSTLLLVYEYTHDMI